MTPSQAHAGPAQTLDWRTAAAALDQQVQRVTALLRSVRNPGAFAVGDWNLAEVALHLSQAWVVVPAMARDDLSDIHEVMPDREDAHGASLMEGVWELDGVTTSGVNSDPERNPAVLADRIEQRAQALFASLDDSAALQSHAWMVQGVTASLPTLICHLLNETCVHGFDIARADGRRWPIEPAHSAMVLESFIFPLLGALGPRDLVDQTAAAGLRATYELHVRGGGRYQFSFDNGALTIAPSGTRKVDCHLSVDPTAMLLVVWRRQNQWAAIGRGQLLAWGRKPWLGPRLRTLMRNP